MNRLALYPPIAPVEKHEKGTDVAELLSCHKCADSSGRERFSAVRFQA